MSLREIEVGDLVRLEDDDDLLIGVGIVLDAEICSDSVAKYFYNIEPEGLFQPEIPDSNLYQMRSILIIKSKQLCSSKICKLGRAFTNYFMNE